MIREKIDRYEIKREIGRGGMANVYYAHDPRVDRDVAIKVLLKEMLSAPDVRERFDREARVIASLDHPAIVPIYDFGEDDGDPFIVMRYMAGGSLAGRLKKGAIPLAEAAVIVDRIASALDRAHSQGIIHRDLKPGNILFDQYNSAYLSDFGIVKVLQEVTAITQQGSFFGTPHYMSPEQVIGDIELDGRADVYSLGVLLYEMLTGQAPYDADTPLGIAFKHVYEEIPAVLEVVPTLPGTIKPILEKALAKNRVDRYSTAGEFSDALLQIAGVEVSDLVRRTGAITTSEAPIETSQEPYNTKRLPEVPAAPIKPSAAPEAVNLQSQSSQRRPAWVLPVLVLALAGILLAAFMLFRGNNEAGTADNPTEVAEDNDPTEVPVVETTEEAPTEEPLVGLNGGGELIVFASGQDPRSYDIFLIDADGSNQSRLTFEAELDNRAPVWSPDGSQIAYRSRAANGNRVIYVMDTDGNNQTAITDDTTDSFLPAWSPDGSKIAFVSIREGNTDIYVMNADGSDQTRLTTDPQDDIQPMWSPDGNHLLFYDDTGNKDIYVMNADGSNIRRLTSDDANDYQARWSPNGSQIVFVSERNGNNAEIYLMNADGTDQIRLTTNTAADVMPTWSPDGSMIVFVSNRDGNNELYLMELGDNTETRLTDNAVDDRDPYWQR